MMGYMNEYLEQYGNKTFLEEPINEIDLVSLSMLPLLNLNKYFAHNQEFKFGDLIKIYLNDFGIRPIGLLIPVTVPRLLTKMAKMRRYQNLLVCNYQEIIDIDREEQFCAIKVKDDYHDMILYSGTDDTCVGWKENFNLLCQTDVLAEHDAVRYLNYVFDNKQKTYIAGHSKGGMLAIYAAAFTHKKNKEKIINVFSFDGPGLKEIMVNSIDYQEIKDKFIFINPQESIIGRLFYADGNKYIVYSKNIALNQHDSQSWEIENNHFKRVDEYNSEGTHILNCLEEGIMMLPLEKRKQFVEMVYMILCAGGNKTLLGLSAHTLDFFRVLNKAPKNYKKVLINVLKKLVSDRVLVSRMFKGIIDFNKYKKENKKALKIQKKAKKA